MLKYRKHEQKKICPFPTSKKLLTLMISVCLRILQKERKKAKLPPHKLHLRQESSDEEIQCVAEITE